MNSRQCRVHTIDKINKRKQLERKLMHALKNSEHIKISMNVINIFQEHTHTHRSTHAHAQHTHNTYIHAKLIPKMECWFVREMSPALFYVQIANIKTPQGFAVKTYSIREGKHDWQTFHISILPSLKHLCLTFCELQSIFSNLVFVCSGLSYLPLSTHIIVINQNNESI